MLRKLISALTATLTALVMSATALAHSPYESDGVARVEREGVEVSVTCSMEIAEKLVGMPFRSTAEFEGAREMTTRAAGEIYEIAYDGQRVEAVQSGARVMNGEVIFQAVYPPANSDELQVRAVYFSRLPVGYRGSFTVTDASGRTLARNTELRKDKGKDTLVVRLKIKEPAPSFVAVPSHASPQPAAGLPERFDIIREWVGYIAALAAIVAFAGRFFGLSKTSGQPR